MRIVRERCPRTEADTPSAVALGLFDGVHTGHRAVIRAVLAGGLRPAVFTFPAGNKAGGLLLTPEQKHAQLAALGVDTCYEPPFESFKTLSPEDFFSQMLVGEYGAAALACGENFSFGAHRAGNTQGLRKMCAKAGVALTVVPMTEYKGEAVSSSRIRAALAAGQLEDVNAMLGRPYELDAPVDHGKKLGSTLGFPTINQRFAQGLQTPAQGVYATQTLVDGRAWPSVTGWGTRPTVDDNPIPSCETFIPGFEGDLYGRELAVRFYKKIDDIHRFASGQELAAAVRRWAGESAAYFEK